MANEFPEGAQTRFTVEQMREVRDAAASSGLSMSAFLRVAALEKVKRGAA